MEEIAPVEEALLKMEVEVGEEAEGEAAAVGVEVDRYSMFHTVRKQTHFNFL